MTILDTLLPDPLLYSALIIGGIFLLFGIAWLIMKIISHKFNQSSAIHE